ncbi:MAG: hypothetical protein JRF63_09445, partial [Deltaproteobacteria bacterium]|nr:hypothetical protein [Deltaproteobacteria bacterium]
DYDPDDEPNDYWDEDPSYDYDDETYDDDYDDHSGSGWGCSGPYLHHDSCKERCRDRHDQCKKDFGYCQDWDADVADAGDCPDCSIEHQRCVEQC